MLIIKLLYLTETSLILENCNYFYRDRFRNRLKNFQPENRQKFKNKPGWPKNRGSYKKKKVYSTHFHSFAFDFAMYDGSNSAVSPLLFSSPGFPSYGTCCCCTLQLRFVLRLLLQLLRLMLYLLLQRWAAEKGIPIFSLSPFHCFPSDKIPRIRKRKKIISTISFFL